VSSAVLYLAIIAIWAGFLVPAWVRRPHAAPAGSHAHAETHAQEHADGELTVEYLTETENDVDVSVETDIHVEVSHHGQAYHEQEYYEHEYSEHRFSELEHGERGHGDAAPGYAGYAAAAGAYDGADGRRDASRPSQSRDQMLRARRRMLTILVGMTLVTAAFTSLGLVKLWICVPPAGMLVLYVLLLREIALADAELARKRAAWEAREARHRAWEAHAHAEREAYEASLADSGAQIIDISGRVSDQLYDQYADAAVRAVGD